jgi:hypothetical protein
MGRAHNVQVWRRDGRFKIEEGLIRSVIHLSSVVCVAGIFLAACEPPSSAPVAVHYPPIVRLVSRHYTIDISAGPRAPVYSIATVGGQMLVSNASLEDLRTEHPELFKLVAPALNPTASAATPMIFADDR